MTERILPLLNSLLLRLRDLAVKVPVAGLLTGKKEKVNTVNSSITIRWTPNYETVAGLLTLTDCLVTQVAGIMTGKARRRVPVAGLITCHYYTEETAAGLLNFRYSRRQTIANLLTGEAERVRPVAGLMTCCLRVQVGSLLTGLAYRVESVASLLTGQKEQKTAVASMIVLSPPSWDQGMMGG
jgi:hypothetical protein